MLQPNHSKLICQGNNIGAGSIPSLFYVKEPEWFGVTRISETAGYPEGYGAKSFVMPLKAGSISARDSFSFSMQGSGAMGLNGEGSMPFSIGMSNVDGQMIVSGGGSMDMSFTMSGTASAVIYGSGSMGFSMSMNHLTSYVEATGHMSADLNIRITMQGTLTAVGHMSGSTTDTTGLTPASIWSYSTRELTGAGVLSTEQQAQLDSIQNNTGLIPALL